MPANPMILLTALASALSPIEYAPRQQRKVGSTNPNRKAQKRQRAARKKQR